MWFQINFRKEAQPFGVRSDVAAFVEGEDEDDVRSGNGSSICDFYGERDDTGFRGVLVEQSGGGMEELV